MKVRFLLIFLLAMIFLILTSIVITYSAIRDSQSAYEKELVSINENLQNNSEYQKKLSLYKAFSEMQAIETTRRVAVIFGMQLVVMFFLTLFYIYGVTRPINDLSAAVKSFFIDKTEKDLLLKESGTEEVRVLVRAFNEMIVKLKEYEKILGNIQKYRGWKEISRIIVHEINNIISPIQTYIEFLIDRIGEKEKLTFILTKLNDIRGVLQKFREISHLPDANLEIQNIVPMVKEVCKEFKNVTFQMADEHDVFLKVDSVLFKEIIRNLVKNAVESGENVQVEVSLSDLAGVRKISVKDNGKGMNRETISKIYEPGYSTKKGNIGIGLSIVKSLAQEQNARIEMESELGSGSCFRVIF